MYIRNNKELSEYVVDSIKSAGMTKTALASKIGMSRQGLDKMLQKQTFSLDDANKILKVLRLKAEVVIKNE